MALRGWIGTGLLWLAVLLGGAEAQVRFQGNQAQPSKAFIFAGYWVTEFHGRFQVGDSYEAPSNIKVRHDLDLDLDDIGVPHFRVTYKDASAYLSVEYFYAQASGKEVAERDFNYDGLTYVSGSLTSSRMAIQSVSGNIGYTIGTEFGLDLTIFAGLRYIHYTSKIAQVDVGAKSNRAEAYMPTIGLRADAELFADFRAYGEVAWLRYSIDGKRIVADHFEWMIGVSYAFTDFLGAYLEYAWMENHLEARNEEYKLELRGVRFGLSLHF